MTTEYCYSFDGEAFRGRYATEAEAINEATDHEAGYIGEVKDPDISDYIDISSILEGVHSAACDDCCAVDEEWLSNFSSEKKAELKELIRCWIMKEDPPRFYTVKNIRSISEDKQ